MLNPFRSQNQKQTFSSARTQSGSAPHIPLGDPLLNRAIKHHQQDQLDEAEKLYKQILKQNPTHADATHLLGALKHQSGDHNSAVMLIEQALAWNPESVLYRKNLMSTYFSAGKLAQAQQTCQEVLASEPNEPTSLSLLAKIHETQQEWTKAIPLLKQAHLHEKETLEKQKILIRLGDALSRAGQHQASAECFRELLKNAPKNLTGHHNLARELHTLGQIEAAIEHYQISLQIDSGCASA